MNDAPLSHPAVADGVAAPASAAGVVANPWRDLRRHTPARIALGRAGTSVPTTPQLAFQAAHAEARDAVHRTLDLPPLIGELEALGLPSVVLHSAAPDRVTYLQRPDLGRTLDEASRRRLAPWSETAETGGADEPPHDVAFVIADGLSSLAVQRHAAPLLGALMPLLQADSATWRVPPVALVEQGRVAIGDEVGAALRAALVVVLIGERPGLSSPDSLGVYVTWSPRVGRQDAERNCISNVRPEGLPVAEAAQSLCWLLQAARGRALTGVRLKDERVREPLPATPPDGQRPFRLA